MNDIEVVVLLIAIAINIIYFAFSVWNSFIRKRLAVSKTDLIACQTAIIFGISLLYGYFGIKTIVSLGVTCYISLGIIYMLYNLIEKEE